MRIVGVAFLLVVIGCSSSSTNAPAGGGGAGGGTGATGGSGGATGGAAGTTSSGGNAGVTSSGGSAGASGSTLDCVRVCTSQGGVTEKAQLAQAVRQAICGVGHACELPCSGLCGGGSSLEDSCIQCILDKDVIQTLASACSPSCQPMLQCAADCVSPN